MYLGIEIGGTKLQVGVGRGDGKLLGLWRGIVDQVAGGNGIRDQIAAAVPKLLSDTGLSVRGACVAFGGPTDDATGRTITSHQIYGWDDFPLAEWCQQSLGVPGVVGNDADLAGLAEATLGAGRGFDPVFYVTVGTGVGGGLILNGENARGTGRGAAEIGHLRLGPGGPTVEAVASGRGIETAAAVAGLPADVRSLANSPDPRAAAILNNAIEALAFGFCQVIALVCPRRIVIGGGVSLLGENLFFAPLRHRVAQQVFAPFAGLTDIVPAALGEEVVVHGALTLAAKRFG